MPSLKTHCEIAEFLGFNKEVCTGVNEIIDSDGNSKDQWEKAKNYIKIKNGSNCDSKEITDLIKEKWWHSKCSKNIPCFFIKAQIAYDNYGKEGLRAYFLRHAVEYADWWQNPPEKYFLLKVRDFPEMTRREKNKLLGYVKYKLYKYQEFSLCPVSHKILLVCSHTLTSDLFHVKDSSFNSKYKFNDTANDLMDDVFSSVKDNFTAILEMVYRDKDGEDLPN